MTGTGKVNPLMAHVLVRQMVEDGGVVTLTQLERRGLTRGAAGLSARIIDEPIDRSHRLSPVTYFAADGVTIRQAPRVLKHLALFGEAGRLLGIEREAWQVLSPVSNARSEDGVWIRGPVGGGLDYAVECDTGYKWRDVVEKIETAGPPRFRRSPTEPTSVRFGYPGMIWILNSRVRADRLGRKLVASLDFEQLRPSEAQRAAGVKVYWWTAQGQSYTVWTLVAHL